MKLCTSYIAWSSH